jgi:hypothetical protein
MASDNGIQVTAVADAWPGNADIKQKLLPLRVIVQNQSRKAIDVSHDAFSITVESGLMYVPIPPREMTGVVNEGQMSARAYANGERQLQLPTPEMRERALGEGVIQSGGSRSGFLYFPIPHADAGEEILLHADLQTSEERRTLAELELPFRMD